MRKITFYKCSICGKKLIGRKPNGIFVFVFAGQCPPPIVCLEIFGSVRMKCIRRSCRHKNPDHWNVFTFFPDEMNAIAEKPIRDNLNKPSANPAKQEININEKKGDTA
jgi:hypothetical protein